MIAKLLESGWAELVYEDDETRILKIRDAKGEPAPDEVEDQSETPDEKKILDEMETNDARNGNANVEDEAN